MMELVKKRLLFEIVIDMEVKEVWPTARERERERERERSHTRGEWHVRVLIRGHARGQSSGSRRLPKASGESASECVITHSEDSSDTVSDQCLRDGHSWCL